MLLSTEESLEDKVLNGFENLHVFLCPALCTESDRWRVLTEHRLWSFQFLSSCPVFKFTCRCRNSQGISNLVDQNTCTDSTFTCMHSTQLASVPQWKLNLYNKGVFLSEHQRLNEDFMSQRGQCESVSSILYSRLWIEKEQCYIAILEVFCDHCSKPALLKKNPQLYSATRPSLWSMPSMWSQHYCNCFFLSWTGT